VLNQALRRGAALIAGGETDADLVRAQMSELINGAPLGKLDYVDVVDPHTLERQAVASRGSRLLGAVRFGRARLIDNIAASEAGPTSENGPTP
jgi:pantoate--beta-alanine ligase